MKTLSSRPAAPEPAAIVADVIESTRAIDANAPGIIRAILAGYTQTEIAAALKIKQYQISRILKKIRESRAADDISRYIQEQTGDAAAAEL